MEAILETKKLSHIYSAGTPFERGALLDVDFTAYQGEYLGIIGHTGSGKSTLIQHLNALLKPTSGQVLFQGQDVWADPARTRQTRFQVGLVFQYPEYQLFEETIAKDIAYGPRMTGIPEEELENRTQVAMELVAMAEPQPKVVNLASVMTPSSIFRVMRMMSPHLALPTWPTPSAFSISPTFLGLRKWSMTFSLYNIRTNSFL